MTKQELSEVLKKIRRNPARSKREIHDIEMFAKNLSSFSKRDRIMEALSNALIG